MRGTLRPASSLYLSVAFPELTQKLLTNNILSTSIVEDGAPISQRTWALHNVNGGSGTYTHWSSRKLLQISTIQKPLQIPNH